MSSSSKPAEAPFAADGGLTSRVRDDEDPYRALDDLMAAVETLCPVWPRRELVWPRTKMLL